MKHTACATVLFFLSFAALPFAQGQFRPVPEPKGAPKAALALPVSVHGEDTQPDWNVDALYDRANPDLNQLQKSTQALAGFALDKKGAVDWMKALGTGAIKPRANLAGDGKMEVLDLDIVMKNTKEMPHVKFPHSSHTQWLACSNCHDQIFVPKAGANPVDMTKIFNGKYCGACHDRIAFRTFFSCERCHSVPQAGTKAWW